MKFIAPTVFGVFCVAYVALVAATTSFLPDPVASHFNGRGEADGWMSRNGYLLFTSLMGTGLPLFIIGITFLVRFFPDWTINLPNKQFWLSPTVRAHTYSYVLQQGFWIGSLTLFLFGSLHILTIMANRATPVRLPQPGMVAALSIFGLGMLVWTVAFLRHFRKPA